MYCGTSDKGTQYVVMYCGTSDKGTQYVVMYCGTVLVTKGRSML